MCFERYENHKGRSRADGFLRWMLQGGSVALGGVSPKGSALFLIQAAV